MALAVYVRGDYAYVANFQSGLAVINVFDPTNPGTPVYEDTPGGAFGVYVSVLENLFLIVKVRKKNTNRIDAWSI